MHHYLSILQLTMKIMALDLLQASKKSNYLLFLSIMKSYQPEKRKKNRFHKYLLQIHFRKLYF